MSSAIVVMRCPVRPRPRRNPASPGAAAFLLEVVPPDPESFHQTRPLKALAGTSSSKFRVLSEINVSALLTHFRRGADNPRQIPRQGLEPQQEKGNK